MEIKLVVCKDFEDAKQRFNDFIENTKNIFDVDFRSLRLTTSTQKIWFHPVVEHHQWRDVSGGQYSNIEFTYAGIHPDALLAVLSRLRPSPPRHKGVTNATT